MKQFKTFFSILFALTMYALPQSFQQLGIDHIIFPSSTTQTEPFITTHPTNPNIIFISANTIKFQPSFFVSEGVYVSTNNGTDWFGSDTCKGSNIQYHGGDPGISITPNGTFILTRLGKIPFTGLFSHYSTDNGITWSNQRAITGDNLERAVTKTDNNSSSSFYGRTYSAWIKYESPYPMMFSYTDDITSTGTVWSSPQQINSPTQRGSGGDITIATDGTVYICWAAVANTSPFNELFIGFASSTNGGAQWSVNENIFSVNGIQGTLASKQNIRVNGLPRIAVDKSGGQFHGRIYIITTQKNLSPAGSDPDIILSYSDNKGVTWSSPRRVNNDALNNGKTQYFPAIHIDKLGGVNVLYYDDRLTTNDSAGVMLSRSNDGGQTWNEFLVSDKYFRPEPIGGLGQGYQGDNIDITSAGNKFFPVWMDNSTGVYQLKTSPFDIALVDNRDENVVLNNFVLNQNYPNPFNPSTIISYRLAASSNVALNIYDVLGNEVATLIDNEWKEAGYYNYPLSIINYQLPSGIYFYRLQTGEFVQTKKMIFLK